MLKLCLCVELCPRTCYPTQNDNITLDVVQYVKAVFVCRDVSAHLLSDTKCQYYVRRGAVFYNVVCLSSCVCACALEHEMAILR